MYLDGMIRQIIRFCGDPLAFSSRSVTITGFLRIFLHLVTLSRLVWPFLLALSDSFVPKVFSLDQAWLPGHCGGTSGKENGGRR